MCLFFTLCAKAFMHFLVVFQSVFSGLQLVFTFCVRAFLLVGHIFVRCDSQPTSPNSLDKHRFLQTKTRLLGFHSSVLRVLAAVIKGFARINKKGFFTLLFILVCLHLDRTRSTKVLHFFLSCIFIFKTSPWPQPGGNNLFCLLLFSCNLSMQELQ